MSSQKVLFGFHAINVRLKTSPKSVIEIYYDTSRKDARMRQFVAKASDMGMRLIESDNERLVKLAGGHGHQGVVAKVQEIVQVHSLDELLENLEQINESTLASERVLTSNPLILVLDGVTDPHNLGACLRVADGAGVQVQEVNRLLKQFEETQKMMKMFSKGGMSKMMRAMGGMMGGKLPGLR